MARIGVPSNKKIFEAVQILVGEEIILPKGAFFVPFRGHELIVARVEEIMSLTKEGYIDLSFITKDYFFGNNHLSTVREFPNSCQCTVAMITPYERFAYKNLVEAFIGFYKETGRRAVLATRFQEFTFEFLWVTKKFTSKGRWEDDMHPAFPEIKKVQGAEELSILLRRADFAVSRIETGETLRLNNLFVVEQMFFSCLIAVRHEGFMVSKSKVEEALSTLLK